MALAVMGAALIAACGDACAAPPSVYHRASLIAPELDSLAVDQREVIAPPSSIDPGMAIRPPSTGARMPVVAPQILPDGKRLY